MITLATLAAATPQEVFDQGARHLLTQGEKSATDGGGCLYRFGKLKCGAGCLISDAEYVEEMDKNDGGSAWWDLIEANLVPLTQHNLLIQDIQRVHDSVRYTPSDWKDQLTKLAIAYSLNSNVCEENYTK